MAIVLSKINAANFRKNAEKFNWTHCFNKTGHACTIHDPQLFLKSVATMVLNDVFCFKNQGYFYYTHHNPQNNKCRGDFSQNDVLDSRLGQQLISHNGVLLSLNCYAWDVFNTLQCSVLFLFNELHLPTY